MKYIALITFAIFDVASAASFNSIVCRKYDHYQLGGDRKVFEVSLQREEGNLYHLQIADLYEVRQSDGSYKIRNRGNAQNPITGMVCTQAGKDIDLKVITCSKDLEHGFDYLSIARMDRTGIMSAMADEPGKIIHYTSYDINLLTAGGRDLNYRQFSSKDCVLDPL